MAGRTKAFDLVNSFIGSGDPYRGLWFIGLEYASEIKDETEIPEYYELGHRFTPQSELTTHGVQGRSIRSNTAKIANPLSVSNRNGDWRVFRDAIMWTEGSKIFQANIYPLGKKDLATWPDHYKNLFGFGREELAMYFEIVTETRFPKIRELIKEATPQAIVCFGKAGWPDFKTLLDLDVSKLTSCTQQLEVYESEELKVVLMPFLTRLPAGIVTTVTEILKKWGVTVG